MRLTVLSKNQQQPPAKTETKKYSKKNDTRHIHTHTNKIKEKE